MAFEYKYVLAPVNGDKELYYYELQLCCHEMGEAWRKNWFVGADPVTEQVKIYFIHYKDKELKYCPYCGATINITQLPDGEW
jgi:hypothetical protein